MLLTCWSTKGGSGTTVVSALLGLQAAGANNRQVLLIDLCGDLPAVFGNPEPASGLAEWLNSDLDCSSLLQSIQELTCNLSLLPRGKGPLSALRAADLTKWLNSNNAPTPVDIPTVNTGMDATTPTVHQTVMPAPLAIVDAGTLFSTCTEEPHAGNASLYKQLIQAADQSIMVTRACYLSLRKAVKLPFRPTGIILVAEPNRALTRTDCERAVGAPVLATIAIDPDIARATDAGMLRTRVPKKTMRGLSHVTQMSHTEG